MVYIYKCMGAVSTIYMNINRGGGAITERYMLETCDKKTLRLNLQISMCVRAVLSYSYH